MTRKRYAKRRAPRLEPLEQRLCLAGFVLDSSGRTGSDGWDGPGTGRASLTYYLAGTPPSNMTITQTEDALVAALKAWAAGADITFSRTSLPNQPNSIDFSFEPIDGEGGILAFAFFPEDVNQGTFAGDVHFDSAEVWEVGNALGDSAIDLVYVATHEVGHALGLEHTDVATAVMFPSVGADQQFTQLDPADDAALLQLYARAGSTPAEPSVATKLPDVVSDTGDDSGKRPLPKNTRRPRAMRPRGFGPRRLHLQEIV